MISEPERTQTIHYISDRQCPSGGYCFYQLDEPNLSDTWYALGCLALLDTIEPDPLTIQYLDKPYPPGRGSIELFRVWYQYWSYLYITGTIPESLKERITALYPPTGRTTGAIESTSALEQLYYYSILMVESGGGVSDALRREIQEAVLQWHHPDGGFGRTHATLVETRHAVAIFKALELPYDKPKLISFMNSCFDDDTGFINVPSVHPGYLEHFDAGIHLAHLLNTQVPGPDTCIQFIATCRSFSGGYTRSRFGGNATLEYTWYALRSLASLHGRSSWRW